MGKPQPINSGLTQSLYQNDVAWHGELLCRYRCKKSVFSDAILYKAIKNRFYACTHRNTLVHLNQYLFVLSVSLLRVSNYEYRTDQSAYFIDFKLSFNDVAFVDFARGCMAKAKCPDATAE